MCLQIDIWQVYTKRQLIVQGCKYKQNYKQKSDSLGLSVNRHLGCIYKQIHFSLGVYIKIDTCRHLIVQEGSANISLGCIRKQTPRLYLQIYTFMGVSAYIYLGCIYKKIPNSLVVHVQIETWELSSYRQRCI